MEGMPDEGGREGGRVLVVDDEPYITDLVSTALRYVGFELEDVFVIGYGLDHAQRYRNLPHIAALDAARAAMCGRLR